MRRAILNLLFASVFTAGAGAQVAAPVAAHGTPAFVQIVNWNSDGSMGSLATSESRLAPPAPPPPCMDIFPRVMIITLFTAAGAGIGLLILIADGVAHLGQERSKARDNLIFAIPTAIGFFGALYLTLRAPWCHPARGTT